MHGSMHSSGESGFPMSRKDMSMNNIEALIELAAALEQQNDYKEVLRLVTQQAARLLDAETALVMMINPSTRETVKTVFREEREKGASTYHTVQSYFTGWIIEKQSGFVADRIEDDPRFNRNILKNLPLTSALGIPFVAEGKIFGSLLLMNKIGGRRFDKEDFLFLKKFATIVSPFVRNTQEILRYFTAPLPPSTLLKKYEGYGLIGKSREFLELLSTIEAAAKCDIRVLLEGGSGTGKELIAKAIHRSSARAAKPFVAIDCGAIPANLIESELFGHLKGSFTGATASRKGLIDESDGGTLFMDEITNLPFDLQAKLLRVLQESEIRPLGANEVHKIDVRIIAASSTSLRQLVAEKRFREDLFYRLYVYPIAVPSLNERKDDIPLLADHFVKTYASQQQKNIEAFHEDLLEFLKRREWQGNIRELENLVARLVTLTHVDATLIDHRSLPPELRLEWDSSHRSGAKRHTRQPIRETLIDYEKEILQKALRECDWNQSAAARMLDISEHSMRYKIRAFKIVKPRE
jgi:transcriptional regulator with GAF, ATPase, and Fis domain